jgi:hypothetical protein
LSWFGPNLILSWDGANLILSCNVWQN